MSAPKWVGLIPARGGSKSFPRNIADVNGIPLIAYTIQCAVQSGCFHTVAVITEDEEIAQVALRWGANVVSRPAELATDSSPTEPSLTHALRQLERLRGLRFDSMALLQCTSPLRMVSDLKRAVQTLNEDQTFDALMSLAPLEAHYHPMWIKSIDEAGEVTSYCKDHGGAELKILEKGDFYQRQRLIGRYYFKDGSIFATRVRSYEELGHRYGTRCTHVPIDPERAYNIDSKNELELVRALLRAGAIDFDFDPRSQPEQEPWSI